MIIIEFNYTKEIIQRSNIPKIEIINALLL